MSVAAYRDAHKRVVVLIGRSNLQNNLLARLLDQHSGFRCVLLASEELSVPGVGVGHLTLLDIDGVGTREVMQRLQLISRREAPCSIALMNAEEGPRLDQIVGCARIKGLFYRQSSHEHFIKGIQAMLAGECWLPRKMLAARWEQTAPARWAEAADLARLTHKEIATLRLLAGGNNNEQIARELNISTHTVKTHVYNVFRKLHLSNRVQAARWAAQHIGAAD